MGCLLLFKASNTKTVTIKLFNVIYFRERIKEEVINELQDNWQTAH